MKNRSMRAILATLVAACAFTAPVSAQDVLQTPLATDHPLLGTWRIDFKDGCFEQYTLQSEGVKLSQSGEERNESIFEISPTPSALGFYKWSDKITKGNGKPDCGGSFTSLNHVATIFIRLHPTGERFLMCKSENMGSCFAEFRRVGRGI